MTEALLLPLLATAACLTCLVGAFWSSVQGLEDRAFRLAAACIVFAICGLALLWMGSLVG